MHQTARYVVVLNDRDHRRVEEVVRICRGAFVPTWTLDWRARTRAVPAWKRALEDAFAALFIATPSAAGAGIFDALERARMLGVPIVGVWLEGDERARCAPWWLPASRVIDARGNRRAEGLAAVRTLLERFAATGIPDSQVLPDPEPEHREAGSTLRLAPPGCLVVRPPGADCRLALKLSRHRTVGSVLSALYRQALMPRFAPYSYGRSWVLREDGKYNCQKIAVPISWLRTGARPPADWFERSPSSVGLYPGYWRVAAPPPRDGIGVAVDDRRLLGAISRPKFLYISWFEDAFDAVPRTDTSYTSRRLHRVFRNIPWSTSNGPSPGPILIQRGPLGRTGNVLDSGRVTGRFT